MEKKFKETHEDNSKIVITQEDIKKASKNPFRSDVLKSTFGIIVGTVVMGVLIYLFNTKCLKPMDQMLREVKAIVEPISRS